MLQRGFPAEHTPFIVGVVLFLLQKYNPTPGFYYDLRTLAKRLFGKASEELCARILDAEAQVLDALGFVVECTTAYDFLGFLSEVADLSPEQLGQAMYCITLAALSPEMRGVTYLEQAAAAVSLVLEKAGGQWDQSLSFWAGCRPSDLAFAQEQIRTLLRAETHSAQAGEPSDVYKKYSEPQRHAAARSMTGSD